MLAIYRQGREIARIPRSQSAYLRGPANANSPNAPDLDEMDQQLGDLGLFEDAARLANVVRWTGIGVLALAGGVLLFKLTDLILGD
jgi:hypothetical protein